MAYDGSIKIDTKVDTSGFSSGIDKLKSIAKTGVTALTTTLAGVSTAIAAGATASVNVGSSFESAMSKVSAISGATGDDLTSLTDKAKEMGAKTKFSASESAEALQYMSMAGWDTKSMLDGIDGIMSLAAADGLDLATTSDIVTDALTAFGLQASDSTHFADVLAKASSSANTNVSMLGESFKYVAPLAGTMGYSVEDVSLALGLMANASIKGSQAGTSLKTALANLSAPTEQMAMVMDKYKISLTDSKGEALPLVDVLKQLRDKFGDLSETEQTAAASTLFGKEAMSGMLAIINASDSDFKNLTENINNADGAAQSMADTMQNNLQGQITILKSSLEGLGIEIYDSMSEPLTEAAVEAQKYVNQLTDAFKSDGLTGLIEEAGNIFGKLAVKAAEEAPKMVEAAVGFIESFVNSIAANSSKLINAAKNIVKTIADNLVKLLPSQVQKPVKEFISTITKSFNDGGLKKAINTVKTILSNLGKVVTNLAKTVIPPLAKVIDVVAGNLKVLLPIATAVYAAFKGYSIISTATAFITAHTAAVTAESLATAASTGAITLKQIAIGALTGKITLATAAQYAWNLAMNLNPVGILVTAVAALAGGIAALTLTMDENSGKSEEYIKAQEDLKKANEGLGQSYEDIGDKFSDFLSDIENSGSIFDNFNENILISDDEKQALADNMDSVQEEITTICRTASDERRELTGGEIQRLEDLFEEMHKLSEQELALEQAKQGVVTSQAQALNEASGISLDEYTQRSKKLANSAEETRTAVIDKAYEQYTEEVALLDQRLETDKEYSKKQHDADVEAANQRYEDAITAANKEAADTLDILQQGYYDRADALKKYTEELSGLNDDEKNENQTHRENLKQIQREYNQDLKDLEEQGLSQEEFNIQKWGLTQDRKKEREEEYTRHTKEITKTRNAQQKILNDENYKDQLVAFLNLEGLYETYSGKMGKKSEDIVKAFSTPFESMPENTKEKFSAAMDGAINGLQEKEDTLFDKAANIAGSVINTFRRIFDEHSPSKVFKKIFKYTLEGGEGGLDDEKPKLYKQAENIAETFTNKMQAGINADGLVSKMRSAVTASKAFMASQLTANVVHSVNINNDENNRKQFLTGDIQTHISVDGREFAVATSPYISEELAWKGANP